MHYNTVSLPDSAALKRIYAFWAGPWISQNSTLL